MTLTTNRVGHPLHLIETLEPKSLPELWSGSLRNSRRPGAEVRGPRREAVCLGENAVLSGEVGYTGSFFSPVLSCV